MRSVDIVVKHNEDWTYSEVTVFNKTENNNYQGGFAYKLNMQMLLTKNLNAVNNRDSEPIEVNVLRSMREFQVS